MIVTLDELKEQLNIWHSQHDAYLVDLEAAAAELCQRYFGYLGAPEEVTYFLIGRNTVDLFLDDEPASSPAVVVTEATSPGGDASGVTDFVVRGKRLRRTGGADWTAEYEYAVTYTRGYAPGTEPETARMAVRLLVGNWYANRTPVSDARSSEVPFTVQVLLPPNPVIA